MFPLSPDQQTALAAFKDFLKNPEEPVFLLRGYAGTGKTFLLQQLLADLQRPAVLLAPTGRAARVMTRQSGRPATTIHRGIYDFSKLRRLETQDDNTGQDDAHKSFKYYFDLAHNQELVGTVFVVDEASMVGNQASEGEFFSWAAGSYSATCCATCSRRLATATKFCWWATGRSWPPWATANRGRWMRRG
ncbi:hypothetical protein GCM10027422_43110 [Hymenobacter arcticus]